jgi:DNA-binding NtrC family response regulator
MGSAENTTARVLVVDDETAICRNVTRTLNRNGFEADSVSSVEALQSILRATPYDVILLDRSMDAPEGGSLLQLVKSLAPSAKVLFFTGEYVDPEEVALVDGVVQKPINGTALADTLRKIV